MSDDAATLETAPAKPPVRFHRLRIAVSVFFGLLTTVLLVLWVRSYWRADYIDLSRSLSYSTLSFGGQVWIGRKDLTTLTPNSVIWSSAKVDADGNVSVPMPIYWTDPFVRFPLILPYWIPLLITLGVTALPWSSWQLSIGTPRFSLRTMLIVTTLAAVVLGMVVWMVR